MFVFKKSVLHCLNPAYAGTSHLMWFSEQIKSSSFRLFAGIQSEFGHKITGMLNLLSVVPAHSGRLFYVWALARSPLSPFVPSALPPFCADHELRCKSGSQQSKQNKPSAVFTYALTKNYKSQKAALLFSCPRQRTQKKSAAYKL